MNANIKTVMKLAVGGMVGLLLFSVLTQWLVKIGMLSDGEGLIRSLNGIFGTVIGGIVTNLLTDKSATSSSPSVRGPEAAPGASDAGAGVMNADEHVNRLKLYAHDLIASKMTGMMVLYLAVAHFVAGIADVKLGPYLKATGMPALKFVATYLQSCLVAAACVGLVCLLLRRYVAVTNRPSLRNALRLGGGGVFLAGLISLFFIHPNLYPLLSENNQLELLPDAPFKTPFGEMPFFGISYLQYLMIFRLVLLPVLATVAVCVAHRYWLRRLGA